MNKENQAIELTSGEKLRLLATEVRNNPTARESIAEAFELIAEAMNPCVDCAAQKQAAPEAPAQEVDQAGAVA